MIDAAQYYFETLPLLRVGLVAGCILFLVIIPCFLRGYIKSVVLALGVMSLVALLIGLELSLVAKKLDQQVLLQQAKALRIHGEVIRSVSLEESRAVQSQRDLVLFARREHPEIFEDYVRAFFQYRASEFSDEPPQSYLHRRAVGNGVNAIKRGWRAKLPEAQDVVFHVMAHRYVPIFRDLATEDPGACAGYMVGQHPFKKNKFYDADNAAVGESLVLMNSGDKVYTRITATEALEFASDAIGHNKVERLLTRTPPNEEICRDLATLFEALSDYENPRAAAAMRYWIEPTVFRGLK